MLLWHLVSSVPSPHFVVEQRWQPFLRPPDPLSLCPPPSLPFVITRTEEGSHLNLAQLCCGCCVHTEAWQVRLSRLARSWVYLHSLLCSPSGQKSIGFCISQHPGKKNHLVVESNTPNHGVDCWQRSLWPSCEGTWASGDGHAFNTSLTSECLWHIGRTTAQASRSHDIAWETVAVFHKHPALPVEGGFWAGLACISSLDCELLVHALTWCAKPGTWLEKENMCFRLKPERTYVQAVELCEAGELHSWGRGRAVCENFNYDFIFTWDYSLLPLGPGGQDAICEGQSEKLLAFQRMPLT